MALAAVFEAYSPKPLSPRGVGGNSSGDGGGGRSKILKCDDLEVITENIFVNMRIPFKNRYFTECSIREISDIVLGDMRKRDERQCQKEISKKGNNICIMHILLP